MKHRPCLHATLAPDSCHFCWLALNNPRYAVWAGPLPDGVTAKPVVAAAKNPVATAMKERLNCIYAGDKVPGKPCGSDLYACTYDHTICSKIKPCTGADRCCQTCPHFMSKTATKAKQVSDRRHLIYHCWPVKSNRLWQRNVEHLRNYLDVFDDPGSQRIVAIVDDKESDADAACNAFEQLGFTVLPVQKNDPKYREVKTWHSLWDKLLSSGLASDEDAVFYAHARGVWRGESSWSWTRMMYDSLLEHPSQVASMIRRYPIVGSFKKRDKSFDNIGWHYSGAFYWMRVGDVADKVRFIHPVWYGVESWPALHFKENEAGVMFYENENYDLYDQKTLATVTQEYEKWKQKQDNTTIPLSIL